MKLQKPRAFGDCWLGCEIWNQLGLDTFWSCRIDTSKSPAQGKRVSKKNFSFTFNHRKYRAMIYRDGMYFLRTNQTGKKAVELLQQYMLQCNVEQAFKELKSDHVNN